MKSRLSIETKYAEQFLEAHALERMQTQIEEAFKKLQTKTGKGKDYLGWLDLPITIKEEELKEIDTIARTIQEDSDVLVVVGIGGSYLGAKAALEMLIEPFQKPKTEIVFAGHQLSSTYLANLLHYLKDKRFSINIISKSGGTTEPMVAFRLLRKLLIEQVGEQAAAKRIFATTEHTDNILYTMAKEEGYHVLDLPIDVGGRYSVLTNVGLLPLAVAGIDIHLMMEGAREAYHLYQEKNVLDNPACRYAGLRNLLYQQGKKMELLVGYEHGFNTFAEWWKQLFAESEGKEGKGIFTASAGFTTDLHSLGQYIQEGERHLFETVVWFEEANKEMLIPRDEKNLDRLNYLVDKSVSFVNQKAYEGVLLAHLGGNVPNILINVGKMDEIHFGHMVYFFEVACGISGYLLDVNPFDQPGVEAYKKNMNQLLGK